jgi:hypothetical protein
MSPADPIPGYRARGHMHEGKTGMQGKMRERQGAGKAMDDTGLATTNRYSVLPANFLH